MSAALYQIELNEQSNAPRIENAAYIARALEQYSLTCVLTANAEQAGDPEWRKLRRGRE